ncbi:hypothetical protein, partial [Aeromonas salmonicida]|uniref:hypothetical protein n=1 Tax=Aeromonas salmonicida TaxID=645 RepID=UPI0037F022EB
RSGHTGLDILLFQFPGITQSEEAGACIQVGPLCPGHTGLDILLFQFPGILKAKRLGGLIFQFPGILNGGAWG